MYGATVCDRVGHPSATRSSRRQFAGKTRCPLSLPLVRFPSRTSKKPRIGGESSLVYSFGMFRHTTTAPCIPSRLHGATMRVSRHGRVAPGWTQSKEPASAAFTQAYCFGSTGNFQWGSTEVIGHIRCCSPARTAQPILRRQAYGGLSWL